MMVRRLALIAFAALCSSACAGGQTAPRNLLMEELTWVEIDALDRERTVVILPIGMVEQHGPHLPVGSDSFGVRYEAEKVAERVSQAGWTVLSMPPLNYGQSGANNLGGRRSHPGTYAMRQSTLRSLVADLGAELARNRFKWIFVMNGHAAPSHHVAVNDACDFVSETFQVTMQNVSALLMADEALQTEIQKIRERHFTKDQITSFGVDVHAGMAETSGMLAIRRDLVDPEYVRLPDRNGATLAELREHARAPDWQGYVSSPAQATERYGRDVEEFWIDGTTRLIRATLSGARSRTPTARYPDVLLANPVVQEIIRDVSAYEAEFQASLDAWLAQRKNR
jgi:creatinine amidohydrolase